MIKWIQVFGVGMGIEARIVERLSVSEKSKDENAPTPQLPAPDRR